MDYEKKYKEALEKARVWKEKSGMPKNKQGILDDIFPELKESEDEKIRKALIRFHKSTIDIDGIKGDEIVAWLEKQGDKDKLIKELGEYKVKYTQEVLEKHLNSMNNKDNERLRKTTIAFLKDFAEQGYENAVECIDWLEKQVQARKITHEEICKSYGIQNR